MQTIDLSIFNFIHALVGRILLVDWLSVFFASYVPYLLIIWAVILLIMEKNWKRKYYFSAYAILSLILSRGIITEIIRHIYFRTRPFVVFQFTPLIGQSPLEASFPSGHATAFFALVLPVFYLGRKSGWWFLAVTTIMAVSRIYVGVHWPLDIIGGAAIGLISSLLIKFLLPKTPNKNDGPTV